MSLHDQVRFKCRKRWCLPYGVWKLAPQNLMWRYITKRCAFVSLRLEIETLKEFQNIAKLLVVFIVPGDQICIEMPKCSRPYK